VSVPGGKRRLNVMTLVQGIFGGAEGFAALLAGRLDPERFESTICATRWQGVAEDLDARERLADTPAELITMSRGSRLNLRPWWWLVREMRRRRIDILHTHMLGSNIWGALIGPLVPVPVLIAHEHSWSWQGQHFRRLLDRHLVARRADAVVAVSRLDRRLLTEVEGIPPEKTRYIPMGIPTLPPPRTEPAAVRAEFGIGPDQPVVGAVAALRPQKNFDLLIHSVAALREEFPGIRLLIVGGDDGTQGQVVRLTELAGSLGIGDAVTLTGPRTDAFDLITSFDVGVLSSDYEGSPRSVLEYMEAAKPVVATGVGGVPDMVRDGETGILVEPRDPVAFADAIGELLRDPDRAAAMGRAGRDLRRREFTIEAMVNRVQDLYLELYEATASPAPRR
jgi:glycosyltransferase involved in cell wall biosynthesis